MTDRNGEMVIWEAVARQSRDVNMAGDVRHFEIPYVKAYLAKRFHMTAIGWKLNDIPRNGNTMVIAAPSDGRRTRAMRSVEGRAILARNAAVEVPTASISVNDIDRDLEQVRQESGEVVHEKQFVGEMG